jgi:hypothetical protein
MENECPVTPPPELVKQWLAEPEYVSGWNGECMMLSVTDHRFSNICAKAAQWGADQELEACCEWLGDAPVVYNDNDDLHPGSYLRDARRPKPPSLKEQALEALQFVDEKLDLPLHNHCNAIHTIRRALEALDD